MWKLFSAQLAPVVVMGVYAGILMMVKYFCGKIDRRMALGLLSSRDHSLRFSPSQISDKPRAVFELTQNQGSGFVD